MGYDALPSAAVLLLARVARLHRSVRLAGRAGDVSRFGKATRTAGASGRLLRGADVGAGAGLPALLADAACHDESPLGGLRDLGSPAKLPASAVGLRLLPRHYPAFRDTLVPTENRNGAAPGCRVWCSSPSSSRRDY